MTIVERIYGAVSEVRPEDELPSDLCDRIAKEWKTSLSWKLRQQIRLGLEGLRFELDRQTSKAAANQAQRALRAIAALKEAVESIGDDFEVMVARHMNRPSDEPWLPLYAELEHARRAIQAAAEDLPVDAPERRPTILHQITMLLLEPYRQATGREPGTRDHKPLSPFVRGVLVAHDALPFRMQEQNSGKPEGQWRRRRDCQYASSVVEALALVPESDRRDYSKERRQLEGDIALLEAHPDELDALRGLSAHGSCYVQGDGALDVEMERRLIERGFLRLWPDGKTIGLEARGEHAWAAFYSLMLYCLAAGRVEERRTQNVRFFPN